MTALWPSLFALVACGRDAVDSPAEKRRTAEPGKPTVPWAFDPSATLAKLDGSWVVQGFGSAGNVTAWRLERGKLTIYNPKTKRETPDELELWSPCKAHLKSGFGGTLVVDGDDIYLGLGDGGTRQGDTIIACMGSGTVYATPKGCATYETRFGEVTVIPTRCSYPDGRFLTLEGGTDHRRSSLRFWGSPRLLLSDQLASSKLAKQSTWEAAKSAADEVARGKPLPPGAVTSTNARADRSDIAKSADPEFPPPPPEDKPDVPWRDDHAPAIASLQGTWLVKGFGSYGAVSAWKIDGAKVTVYNPGKQTETPDVLIFESPCAVRLDSGSGGTLVIDGDVIYLGLGAGGTKHEGTISACMGSGTVVATTAGCATYHEELGTWSKVKTTCKEADGRFVATEKSSYGESTLRFVNDHTLLSDQLAASKLIKQPDWASAKAAAAKR